MTFYYPCAYEGVSVNETSSDDTCLDVVGFWSVTVYVLEIWNENVFLVIWNENVFVVIWNENVFLVIWNVTFSVVGFWNGFFYVVEF